MAPMQVVREGNCGKCGYDLTGLALVGCCPECGNAYDGNTRAGFASHAAQKQAKLDRVIARLRTGCLLGLGAMALSCAGVASFTGWGDAARAFAVGLVFALFFGLAAVVSYLYEKPEP